MNSKTFHIFPGWGTQARMNRGQHPGVKLSKKITKKKGHYNNSGPLINPSLSSLSSLSKDDFLMELFFLEDLQSQHIKIFGKKREIFLSLLL